MLCALSTLPCRSALSAAALTPCFRCADALTESFFEEGHRLESIRLNVPIDDCGCLPGLGYSSAAHACVEGSTTNVTEANACLVRWKTPGEQEFCNNYSWLDALVTFLPYYFRFAQQCRRYVDSGFQSRRDLCNAGKYSTSLAVVTLSWADHTFTADYVGHPVSKWDIFASPYKLAWAGMVVICAVYKLVWDVKQDWKLCEKGSGEPQPHYLNCLQHLSLYGGDQSSAARLVCLWES